MPILPISRNAYNRRYTGAPEIHCQNRYFEENPANFTGSGFPSLIARCGSDKMFDPANGGVSRGFYSAAGFFDGDLFAAVGTGIFRYSKDGTLLPIIGTISDVGRVQFAFQSGAGYQRLFFTDGANLHYYGGANTAKGSLTASTGVVISSSHKIEIGGTYFSWGADMSTSPAGTVSDPFLAKIGANTGESLANMMKLINASGIAGVDYSINVINPSTLITGASATANQLKIESIATNVAANDITTTVVSGAGIAFTNTHLEGGGTHTFTTVAVPDDKAVSSVVAIKSYILFSLANSDRFYWINPAETTVDALNFATAESSPDHIVQILTVGDAVWLIGQETTEVWAASGDITAPFLPIDGRSYERGAIEGTAVKVKDSIILVGDDYTVYSMSGQVSKISNYALSEAIRKQIKTEV